MLRFTILVGILLITGTSTVLMAQGLIPVPLEDNYRLLRQAEQQQQNGRSPQVCPTDTLNLPFFDDFSNAPSIYPRCSHWLDNQVYINADMAYRPPSVGVATFEGLDWDGSPYNEGASTSIGSPADTLTSQPIRLGGKTAADAIYLSYYYQPQGLSDRPEEQDSLFLDFKDTSGTWQVVWRKGGLSSGVSIFALVEFEQIYIALNDARYLYDGFQFRFRNYAAITGNNDHWHLDYIFMDENRTNNADINHPTYGSSADVTFTQAPTTPLRDSLTAMPWRHFRALANPWASTFVLENFNHNHSQVATLDRTITIEEIAPNSNTLLTENIPAVGAYGPSPNLNDSLFHSLLNTPTTFQPTEKTTLETTYQIINPSGFQSNPIYEGNDTVRRQTILHNYLAYDDGTAETRVIAQGIGTKIAVEYTSYIQDTLQGIYFHLPYFRAQPQRGDFVNVKVWLDSLSDATEVFSRDLHRLQFVWGHNGFCFVDLVDFSNNKILVFLNPGQKFYVGWQQSFGPEVPVGFDRSIDNSHRTFVGVGSQWTPSDLAGTVMIRPLLSPNAVPHLIAVKPLPTVATPHLVVYPNPAQDWLNLDLQQISPNAVYTVSIYDKVGRVCYQHPWESQLSIVDWQPGWYVVVVRDEEGQIIARQPWIKS